MKKREDEIAAGMDARAMDGGPEDPDVRPQGAGPASFKDKEKSLDNIAEMIVAILEQTGDRRQTFKQVMDFLERNVLVKCLNKHNGNQRLSSRFLSLKPTTLCAKLRKHRIQIHRFSVDASYPAKAAPIIDPKRPTSWGFLYYDE